MLIRIGLVRGLKVGDVNGVTGVQDRASGLNDREEDSRCQQPLFDIMMEQSRWWGNRELGAPLRCNARQTLKLGNEGPIATA